MINNLKELAKEMYRHSQIVLQSNDTHTGGLYDYFVDQLQAVHTKGLEDAAKNLETLASLWEYEPTVYTTRGDLNGKALSAVLREQARTIRNLSKEENSNKEI